MATVKIILRKNLINKNGKVPLRIRLLNKGKIKEITIPGVRINPKMWNPISQTIKGDKMLNLRLENKVAEYKSIINKMLVLGKSINLDDVHNVVEGVKDPTENILVHEYIKDNILEDIKLSFGTRKYYKTLFKILQKEYPKLKLCDVDGEFLVNFDEKLRQKKLSTWTRHSRLKCMKRAVNRAYEDRLIEMPDWKGFKNKRGTSTKSYLSKEEVSSLRKLLTEIKIDTTDCKILRAFLFSCCCSGMRFGDLLMLSYTNIRLSNNGEINLSYTI